MSDKTNDEVEETLKEVQTEKLGQVVKPKRDLISFPFMLTRDLQVSLYLPFGISQAEADRIKRYVDTLVLDEGLENYNKSDSAKGVL